MKILLLTLIIFTSCATEQKNLDITPTNYNWDEIVEKSKGTEVTIYMWGGHEIVNRNFEQSVIPRLKELNDITLVRVPVDDIRTVVNSLIVEKQANRKKGSADILWINGENFKDSKESGILWGSFASGLPSMAFIDTNTTISDFGTPIEGYEAPWGAAQFNFIYDGVGTKPFSNAQSLLEYAKANPDKVTYPAIPDFTGSAFVRNIASDILGFSNIVNMSNKELENSLQKVWDYFNELKPYLWKKGETYPSSMGQMDVLFQNRVISIMMNYQVYHVSQRILSGLYPETSKSFILDNGTIFNNNYFTIPWNSPNTAGALYVINYFLSEEAQLMRLDPKVWGWPSILDLNKVSLETREKTIELSKAPGVVPLEELEAKRIYELSPEKLAIIEKGWLKYVAMIKS